MISHFQCFSVACACCIGRAWCTVRILLFARCCNTGKVCTATPAQRASLRHRAAARLRRAARRAAPDRTAPGREGSREATGSQGRSSSRSSPDQGARLAGGAPLPHLARRQASGIQVSGEVAKAAGGAKGGLADGLLSRCLMG